MAGAALLKQGKERRRDIMRFLKKYHRQNGYSPSIGEIADAVGLASKTAVRHHLQVLEDEGKVTLTPGRFRAVRVR